MPFVRMAAPDDLDLLEAFDEWKEATRARIEAGECAVAGEGDEVWAYAVFDRSFFKEDFVAYVLVHPEHRRQGLGSALLEYVESSVAGDVLYISTGLRNVPMYDLLNRRGYRLSGMVDLEGYSELIFAKKLAADSKDS